MSMTGKNKPLDGSYRENGNPLYPHEDRYHDHTDELLDIVKSKGYTDEEAEQWLDDVTTDNKERNRKT